jgi:hypothetical protein
VAKKTSAHGGARKGAGRKSALSDIETWEAGNLCDLLERRKLKAWALRAAYGDERLAQITAAQQALREHSLQFRTGGDGLEQLLDDAEAAFHVAGPVSDDVHDAAEYEPVRKLPRYVVIEPRAGRRPDGIAARERVIEIVARFLRRKWRGDGSPKAIKEARKKTTNAAIRKAWKASRGLWRKLIAESGDGQ